MQRSIFVFFTFVSCVFVSCTKSETETQSFHADTEISEQWIEAFESDDFHRAFETFYSHQDLLKANSKILSSNQKLQVSLQTTELPPESVYLIGLKTKNSKSFFSKNEKGELKIFPHQIGFTLDWNQQFNGSYLSAGLIITSDQQLTSQNTLNNFIAIEYIGVPPGKNARLQISEKRNGNVKILHDEGWPLQQREGKLVGIQKILARFSLQGLEVQENNQIIIQSLKSDLFQQALYFYFFVQSHNNYFERTVFFDDILIQPMK